MSVVIIDYGSGNLRSAAKAFERAACATNQSVIVSDEPSALTSATHIVLPGVGAFADCMKGLENISGLRAALETHVLKNRKPFLGICVGMQMLFDNGFEHGSHKGLGWIGGDVAKIVPQDGLKIPHMGWNTLDIKTPEQPLLNGIASGEHAYFVHSYHAVCKNTRDIIATTQYGGSPLTAIVAKGNIMGTQFHPEKSQETGLRLIENFLKLRF